MVKVAGIKVDYRMHMGDDLNTVNVARVSFNKESSWVQQGYVDNGEDEERHVQLDGIERPAQYEPYEDGYPLMFDRNGVELTWFMLSQKDEKLTNYLARHDHWSPFAHNFISFRVKAPIFVARQLVKHQVGLVWNEVSRRYVDDEPEFYIPDLWRHRADNVKQGSAETGISEDVIGSKDFCDHVLAYYIDLLESGVAPEQARMVLPQNTMTEWIWSGSFLAFVRVVKQRTHPTAQKETREVAEQIAEILKQRWPVGYEALMKDVIDG